MRRCCLIPVMGVFLFGNLFMGEIPQQSREALMALYTATDGDNWANNENWRKPGEPDSYNDPGTECTWYGVTCDNDENDVITIDMSGYPEGNNLVGPIPLEIVNLVNLRKLVLQDNYLHGVIPSELGNMTTLTWLSLARNELSGAIPRELGNLTNLTRLYLNSNQLTGIIPSELGNLTGLVRLDLYVNQLSGSIPPELANLTNLEELHFFVNRLSGAIPPWLGNLSDLTMIMLYDNQFTGPIPSELANLPYLKNIELYNNQLSGPIPSELGNIVLLERLTLDNNRLNGPIPSQLGDLSNLERLFLHGNKLQGAIPDSLANLTNLQDGTQWYNSGLRLEYNAIYTNNQTLRDFLNSKHMDRDFEATQTIAPENGAWAFTKANGGRLTWKTIRFTEENGGYEIWMSLDPGGPYNYVDITEDKTIQEYALDCLGPGTTYTFALQTVTEPHLLNQNRVVSELSTEVVVPTAGERGDVNGDGLLNAADLLALANFLAENIYQLDGCLLAGDLNGDMVIDSVDRVLLMRLLVQ